MKKTKGKKGAGMFIAIIFAVFFFMIGMWMIPFMQDGATEARTSMDCTNSSISDGAKVTCLFVGGGVPYFILAILTFAGGLIGSKL